MEDTGLFWEVLHSPPLAGACTADLQAFCKGVKPGDSNLADCISNQLKLEKAAVEDTGKTGVGMYCAWKKHRSGDRLSLFATCDVVDWLPSLP